MSAPLPEAELAELVALFNRRPRLLYREIAALTGRDLGNISWWSGELIAKGLIEPRRANGCLPPSIGQIERMRSIVAARQEGKTWREIGRHYGTSFQAVQNFYTRHANRIGLAPDDGSR